MSGHDEDSENSETEVLPGPDVAPGDLEGTLEMDREALIARIQADRRGGADADSADESDESERAQTLQVPSVSEDTQPTKTAKLPAVSDKTQDYDVPDSVMEELRKENLHTLDIPLEAIDDAHEDRTTNVIAEDEIVEFTAIVDRNGRVQLPDSVLRGRYKPGRRVFVVMRLAEQK